MRIIITGAQYIKDRVFLRHFETKVQFYTSTHHYYDRLDDSCVHALLECLNIPIPNIYGLSTQSGLSLVIEHFGLPKPNIESCLKDPLELGGKESQRLEDLLKIIPQYEFEKDIKLHLGIDI